MNAFDPRLLVAVLVGGGLGSVLRYGVTMAVTQRVGQGFAWGTLLINLTGSLAIGLVAGWLQTRGLGIAPVARTFLTVGLLGGFTTFSAFSLDTLTALAGGAAASGVLYAGLSVIGGILAAFAGIAVARAF